MKKTLLDIREFVEKHYRDRPGIKKLAQMAGMPELQFLDEFRLAFGMTPREMMYFFGLRDAEMTLVRSTMSVRMIAERYGFPDTQAYRDSFLGEYGEYPESYRSKHRYDPSWRPLLQSAHVQDRSKV